MRAPSSLYLTTIGDGIARLRTEQARSLAQASSGRRINQLADDPQGSARATELRAQVASLTASAAAAVHGRSALDAADQSLGAMQDILAAAEQMGGEGASNFLTPSSRAAIAAAIRGQSDALLAEANKSIEGYTIFSGAQTGAAPFTRAADGSFVYAGDATVRRLDLGGEDVALNVPGDAVLAGSVNAGTALETLAQAVAANDVAGVAAALQQVEAARAQVDGGRTTVGLATAHLERAVSSLQDSQLGLTASLSAVEDADVVQVATDLSRLQVFLDAAMGAAAKSPQRTLFDLLA